MSPSTGRLGRSLRRRAEDVLAVMLAVMFVAFLLQIVFRYLLNLPVGWTSEMSIIAWLWGVLWGAAFVVKVERTAYLKIRFDYLFSIYAVFVVAVIVRYLWILSRLFRGKEIDEPDLPGAGSAL